MLPGQLEQALACQQFHEMYEDSLAGRRRYRWKFRETQLQEVQNGHTILEYDIIGRQ